MATLYEIQQAKKQQQAQQTQQTSAIIGTAVETLGRLAGATTNFFATAIGVLGGTGIALSQFFKTQNQANQQAKITAHQQFVTSNVDSILSQLQQAGDDLIDRGFNPTSPDFEQALYTNLYSKIGYLGNCDISVWIPSNQSSANPNTPPSYVAATPPQTWFTIKSGSLISTSALMDPPPNIDTYWTTKCQGIHDSWMMSYQDKLVAEGRTAEDQALQTTLSTSRLTWQVIFGLAIVILIVMVFFRSSRIK